MCPQLWVIVCVVESPSVRLPRKYFAGWRHTEVMTALLRWWCAWPVKGLCAHMVPGGWMHPVCVTKEYALVHCWVSGAAHGCSCWALMSAGHVGCGWLCVGVVLCENCIVDASIFLFCVLVFVP